MKYQTLFVGNRWHRPLATGKPRAVGHATGEVYIKEKPTIFRRSIQIFFTVCFVRFIYYMQCNITIVNTISFFHLYSFIEHIVKSLDNTNSLLKQLDNPKTKPKSESSPDFCTELWKIQICIPVFCDLYSIIKRKG